MTYKEMFYPTQMARRHHPDGYNTYQAYKPWLRDEFVFRCVYCLEREMFYPNRDGSFSVEHVKPKKPNPGLKLKYSNLVYACCRCNSWKRQVECLNPVDDDLSSHLRVEPDGIIKALTREGRDLVKLFHLNEDPALPNRRAYINLIELYRDMPHVPRIVAAYKNLFGYPDSLPDLAATRPPTNHCPGSVATSYHQQRIAGTLSDTY